MNARNPRRWQLGDVLRQPSLRRLWHEKVKHTPEPLLLRALDDLRDFVAARPFESMLGLAQHMPPEQPEQFRIGGDVDRDRAHYGRR